MSGIPEVLTGVRRWAVERWDALSTPWPLPEASVHMIMTSPPYIGLRDYQVDGQIGDEGSVEEYVEKMVAVFREAHRVLRDDGTVWLNLGDTYASDGGSGTGGNFARIHRAYQQRNQRVGRMGVKQKDLLGIPWEVALALRRDGWYLRRSIIWHKLNPMPESVKDRPTASHEYIFLLAKEETYFYDADAAREPPSEKTHSRGHGVNPKAVLAGDRRTGGKQRPDFSAAMAGTPRSTRDNPHPRGRDQAPQPGEAHAFHPAGRNLRDVWSFVSEPYKGPHFATFPIALPRRCIALGTSEVGCCRNCGGPISRVSRSSEAPPASNPYNGKWSESELQASGHRLQANIRARREAGYARENCWADRATIAWRLCGCGAYLGPPAPCIVLDPFMGSGSTAVAALRLGRRVIGFDLDPSCVQQATDRIVNDAPLLNALPPDPPADPQPRLPLRGELQD